MGIGEDDDVIQADNIILIYHVSEYIRDMLMVKPKVITKYT